MSEDPTETPLDKKISSALASLRAQAADAVHKARAHRERAEELIAEAQREKRAYISEYRALKARGFFTTAQLRDMGLPAPRTRPTRTRRKTEERNTHD